MRKGNKIDVKYSVEQLMEELNPSLDTINQLESDLRQFSGKLDSLKTDLLIFESKKMSLEQKIYEENRESNIIEYNSIVNNIDIDGNQIELRKFNYCKTNMENQLNKLKKDINTIYTNIQSLLEEDEDFAIILFKNKLKKKKEIQKEINSIVDSFQDFQTQLLDIYKDIANSFPLLYENDLQIAERKVKSIENKLQKKIEARNKLQNEIFERSNQLKTSLEKQISENSKQLSLLNANYPEIMEKLRQEIQHEKSQLKKENELVETLLKQFNSYVKENPIELDEESVNIIRDINEIQQKIIERELEKTRAINDKTKTKSERHQIENQLKKLLSRQKSITKSSQSLITSTGSSGKINLRNSGVLSSGSGSKIITQSPEKNSLHHSSDDDWTKVGPSSTQKSLFLNRSRKVKKTAQKLDNTGLGPKFQSLFVNLPNETDLEYNDMLRGSSSTMSLKSSKVFSPVRSKRPRQQKLFHPADYLQSNLPLISVASVLILCFYLFVIHTAK